MKLTISLILLFFFVMAFGTDTKPVKIPEKEFTGYKLRFEGIERNYLVHMPVVIPDHRLPVLFCLHGAGGTAKGMIRLTRGRFNELSDRDGFIVVYPDAIRKSWNDGRYDKFSYAAIKNINDAGFILEIVQRLKKDFLIDETRIYTCGMSNGGFMSMRIACELSGVFCGAAAVGASLGLDYINTCKPVSPVSILFMNGTSDPLVPYQGGSIGLFRKTRGKIVSTDNAVKFWVERNECTAEPIKDLLPDKDVSDSTRVEKYVFTGGKNKTSVVLFRVLGGGHTWPGGLPYLREGIIGRTCRDINACDEIWEFFKN